MMIIRCATTFLWKSDNFTYHLISVSIIISLLFLLKFPCYLRPLDWQLWTTSCLETSLQETLLPNLRKESWDNIWLKSYRWNGWENGLPPPHFHWRWDSKPFLELSLDLILPFPYLRTYILSVKVWKLPWWWWWFRSHWEQEHRTS